MNRQCEECSVDFFRTDYLSLVCPSCGAEHFEDMYESNTPGVCNYAALQSGYSRDTRFNGYLQAVLGITSGPSTRAKIWKHLEFCDTLSELLDQIKGAPVKTKFYESFHAFAKVFWRGYQQPAPVGLYTIQQIKTLFSDVQFAFGQIYGTRAVFFSYPWLLYVFLEALGKQEYLKFIKNLKCKKRSANYLKKLKLCVNHLIENGKNISPLCTKVQRFLQRETAPKQPSGPGQVVV